MEGLPQGPIPMADGFPPCGESGSILRTWEPCIDGKMAPSAQLLNIHGTTALGGLRKTLLQKFTAPTRSSTATLSTIFSQLMVTQVREI